MQRTNVMLLFGGESSEHTVSITSARNVYAAIDDTKFDVSLCYITEHGKWLLVDSFEQVTDSSSLPQIVPILGSKSFMIMSDKSLISPDVILPILHGENGEDGSVQGLAKLSHIPIVGCDIAASAVCIDKVIAKQLLQNSGINVVPYEIHNSGDLMPSFRQLSEKLGDTLFIKPARCGSSVGINKATNDDELSFAIEEAHKYDNKILIERSINARELEVGALGSGANTKISCVGEIAPDGDFYTFESKYSETSKSQVIIPAQIDDEMSEIIKSTAMKAYKVLGCSGLSRIDFFLSDENTLYLNEVNTLPGFTNISMYPKLWRHEGILYNKLIEMLINDALNR